MFYKSCLPLLSGKIVTLFYDKIEQTLHTRLCFLPNFDDGCIHLIIQILFTITLVVVVILFLLYMVPIFRIVQYNRFCTIVLLVIVSNINTYISIY